MIIYELDNVYYLKENDLYYVAEITIKKHTIVVTPTSEYVEELEGATEYTYKELKRKLIGKTNEIRL